jgi:hypothetical protein
VKMMESLSTYTPSKTRFNSAYPNQLPQFKYLVQFQKILTIYSSKHKE